MDGSAELKTCALVGASEFNADVFEAMNSSGAFDFVISVDGGYSHLSEIGVIPHLAIGDFDSLGYVPEDVQAIKHPAHKDASDMELAIDYAADKGFGSFVVFGALGGRLDHTLANLQVFAKVSESGNAVRAVGLTEELFMLTGPASMDFDQRESGTLSVFAMDDNVKGLIEKGLEWELDRVGLEPRTSLGLSNEFIGKESEVSIEKGTIAVIVSL